MAAEGEALGCGIGSQGRSMQLSLFCQEDGAEFCAGAHPC